MLKHILILAAILCLLTLEVTAETVFYQPQTRDAELASDQWQSIFADLQAAGYTGLVFQWTRFNDEDFGGVDGWLGDTVEVALTSGLDVHLGLHWDSGWFADLNGDSKAWGDRVNQLMQRNRAQARQWQAQTRHPAFSGWYLPLELPDRGLADTNRQQVLRQQLRRLNQALDQPLAVSSYFTGFQSPQAYADWLQNLVREAGVSIWVQDGAGVQNLTSQERRAYLAQIDCSIGIIREVFEQISKDGEAFLARPRESELPRDGSCHRALAFSLRYLPAGDRLSSGPE